MKPLDSMRRRLQPMGAYDLQKENSFAAAKLEAFAAGLDSVYDMLNEIEQEAFLVSAQSWGFSGVCSLLGIVDGGDLRRAVGLFLCSPAAKTCTRASFQRLQQALGIAGPLYECPADEKVIFCPETLPEDRAFVVRVLRRMLPAQLQGELDLSGADATWKALDSGGASWKQQDAKNRTWKTWDGERVIF
ncbi:MULTISPECIES: hypothetical protein [Caproicibacterium]|uniref:Uncharacterized protein n=1 Tax=Caproicibacterium lactatifermentans TaxID=2666138 RepID=A0A859DMB4_9FIRM|nr:hypothetical protein [Caproicibacterium lactatifermentans]ARP49540.1 hypothetical protein B6259_00685 [Ruminococcaceae bacterium CPB6]MDD4807852.1 hypothetical protein [Oscillospiraceae bacterium]QKN23127.1 hypothetical protein GJQ69_00665 [Caproicibacterium lactatifermentans]QKO30267.1 hypothetical protein GKP14_04105 [Caproicibacterium lactatifermentans]